MGDREDLIELRRIDELEAKAKGVSLAKPSAPSTPEKSWADVGSEALQNFIPSVGKLAMGSIQGLGTLGVAAAQQVASHAGNPFSMAYDTAKYLYSPEGQQQIVNTAKAVGGDFASRYGTVEGLKKNLAEDPASYLADASLLLGGVGGTMAKTGEFANLNRLATIGKGVSAVGEAIDPFALTTSALKGTGQVAQQIPAVNNLMEKTATVPGRMASATREYLGNVFDPVTGWIRKTARGHEADILAEINKPDVEIVPGITPTFGEKILGANRVEPIAGEKAILEQGAGSELYQRELTRKQSLGGHLTPAAGNEGDLAAAQAIKEADRAKFFGDVDTKMVEADSKLDNIFDRVKNQITKARDLAAKENRPFSVQPEAIPGGEAKPAWARDLGMKEAPQLPPEKYSGRSLDQVHKVLTESIKELTTSGFANTEIRAMQNLRGELEQWMAQEGKLPEHAKAVENFAQNSKDIHRMEVGQFTQKLVSDINNPGGEAKFLTFMNDPQELIRTATGRKSFKSLEDLGFNNTEIQRFEDVQKEIERRNEYMRQAKYGGKSDLEVGEPWKHVSVLNIEASLANMGMAIRGKALSKSAAGELRDMMLQPENGQIARAYNKAIELGDKRAAQDAMLKLLPKIGAKIITNPAAVSAGRINALAPQTEQQNNLTP